MDDQQSSRSAEVLPVGQSSKRSRPSDDEDTPAQGNKSPRLIRPSSSSHTTNVSNFRNITACYRCRTRKNRCDQGLPACAACEKANVKCRGYDPITKQELPRSYVYYLETRVNHLQSLLRNNGIQYPPPEEFELGDAVSLSSQAHVFEFPHAQTSSSVHQPPSPSSSAPAGQQERWPVEKNHADNLNKLATDIGLVSVQGIPEPRSVVPPPGNSFLRVVLTAVKSSVSGASPERGAARPGKPAGTGTLSSGGSSMRDSFFGLHTKPNVRKAPFPHQTVGRRLADLYFEHANPQIPILHRGEFMALFDRAYKTHESDRTARELYLLNIVFAIGAGIFLNDLESDETSDDSHFVLRDSNKVPLSPITRRARVASQECQPEEYHAAAIVHLENFLGSSTATDRPDGFGAGLEELQAVLLLAGFALLRPVAPGLWYIVGVAVRLGLDLGLHYEDGTGIDANATDDVSLSGNDGNVETQKAKLLDPKERGRREWVRDLRRRLWWCVYSFDRLVSTCVSRPFGVSDQVITTEFPSVLDDEFITKDGFVDVERGRETASYKHVAHHYFRLRLLQSEILQVIQHQQARQARASGSYHRNEFIPTDMPSPFLQAHDNSFHLWRKDVARRLREWKDSAPTRKETGVDFSVRFLELNYWQAIIMLYRQSLSVPPMLADEWSNPEEISSPSIAVFDNQQDEVEVFLLVAKAGESIIQLYRELHYLHLVNYTFLATHHIFMAGVSFLYALWYSPAVREKLSMQTVDFTVFAATSVLADLVEKCPPAETCREAFQRMAKMTVQKCLTTTGFGPEAGVGLQNSSRRQSLRPPKMEPVSEAEELQDEKFVAAAGPISTTDGQPLGQFPTANQGAPRGIFTNVAPMDGTGELDYQDNGSGLFDTNTPQNIDFAPVSQSQTGLSEQTSLFTGDVPMILDDVDFNDLNFNDGDFDLGFGMGLDVDHDFSSGSHGLLDEYWFGGQGPGF